MLLVFLPLIPVFTLFLFAAVELAMLGLDDFADIKLLRYLCPVAALALGVYSIAAVFLKSLPYPNGHTLPLNDPISAGVLEWLFVNPVYGSVVSFFALAGCIIVLRMTRSPSRR